VGGEIIMKRIISREFCWLCEKRTDFNSDDGYYNVDVESKVFRLNITKGCCSWAPHMEIVFCRDCVVHGREKCAAIIMDLLR
jgi:hypothetical protein